MNIKFRSKQRLKSWLQRLRPSIQRLFSPGDDFVYVRREVPFGSAKAPCFVSSGDPPSASHEVFGNGNITVNSTSTFRKLKLRVSRLTRGLKVFTFAPHLDVSASPCPLRGSGVSRSVKFSMSDLHAFLNPAYFRCGVLDDLVPLDVLTYKECALLTFNGLLPHAISNLDIVMVLPVDFLVPRLPCEYLRRLCGMHLVKLKSYTYENMSNALLSHSCDARCHRLVCILERPVQSCRSSHCPPLPHGSGPNGVDNTAAARPSTRDAVPPTPQAPPKTYTYPPPPVTPEFLLDIIREWAQAVSIEELEESACASCGQLSLVKSCQYVPIADPCLRYLIPRTPLPCQPSPDEPLLCNAGILRHPDGDKVRLCRYCHSQLKRRVLPRKALANGMWLGDVPIELQRLNFVEKLLVARYRHNVCVVRVAKGQRKMFANAIVFPQPVAQFTNILPPTKAELDECLVVLFSGPTVPTAADYKRTPFLVRPALVRQALEWLIQNHSDYKDITISLENLKEYEADPDNPPVYVEVRKTNGEGNVEFQNLPSYGDDTDIGSEDGPCPLAVAGLVGEHLSDMSKKQKIAIALQHLESGKPFILYGHSSDPESIYGNPQLYPGMFPWLFPYGFGGFDNDHMPLPLHRATHIRSLLMYYDRRFQIDEYFSFLAFNQMQIAQTIHGGRLLVTRKNFENVTEKILALDMAALQQLTDRALENGFVRAEDDAEKAVLEIISTLDHIGGHVPGSNTQRRYQRNEIRSLMYEMKTPAFFITFAPVDFKSPICLYYSGHRIDLSPLCPANDSFKQRMNIIAENPVACARFFHLMVKLFIKIILKADSDEEGLFGKTSAYYGTVEAQGRLTLHLHLLLWIENSLSPQAIRDKVTSDNTEFKDALVAWLESTHRGNFCTGDMFDIATKVTLKKTGASPHVAPSELNNNEAGETSKACPACEFGDPTLSLPHKIPSFTSEEEARVWLQQIYEITDEIVYHSNRHNPNHETCKRPDGSCKARFPRETHDHTFFDEKGNLNLRKTEKWINTFSIAISYAMRCNSDVTSLLSGTQVKAVIAYVTDYITKTSLKCHVIFEAVRAVIERNPNIIESSKDRGDAARRLLTKIVNATIARQEIGAPMVCAHLLGYGDHYTNMKFKPFYWYLYVTPVARAWNFNLSTTVTTTETEDNSERVMLKRTRDGILPWSKVHDYILRPPAFEHYSLYEFLRTTVVKKLDATSSANMERCTRRTPDSKLKDIVVQDLSSEEAAQETLGPDIPDNVEFDDDLDEEIEEIPVFTQCYEFSAGHPNRKSHAVFKVKDERAFILNYIGGLLPRPDQGDCERYCIIMLTLFKPDSWRDPKNMKLETASWEDTFQNTVFTPRSIEVMKNMNLLYECYEASHDFSAARRKARAAGQENVLMTENIHTFSVIPDDSETPDIDEADDYLDRISVPIFGRAFKAHKNAMTLLTETTMEIMTMFPSDVENQIEHNHGIDSTVISEVASVKPPTHGWRSALKEANKQRLLSQQLRQDPTASKNSASGTRAIHYSSAQGTSLEGKVTIINKSELIRLTARHAGIHSFIDKCPYEERIAQDFCLNLEQNRAFRIICAYLRGESGDHESDTLKMYLGGIGGTGKSTVIKAVITFLECRNEAHRYAVLAPTGSAACLLEGSTYHSALGLNPKQKDIHQNSLDDLKDRFATVDLIFLDEVSMLSCEDMYRITRQLCEAFNKPMSAFGGKHVVFAGDFGQLQPAGWGATCLYSNKTPLDSLALNTEGLMKALGKSVWHQFTTVVILRENMHQRGMSELDKKFRICLENMRYGRCTAEDIALLRTRIARPGGPSIQEPQFRNVSIITPLNAQRDAWNSEGVDRFAAETGQTLHRFHCIDTGGSSNNTPSLASDIKQQQKKVKSRKKSNLVPAEIQRQLWSLPPSLTDHVAAKLDLCIGLPVLLKHNEATELCATNGAEATVVGWNSYTNVYGTETLSTLYVKLKNPARNMKMPTLPENVVPLTATSHDIRCVLPERAVKVGRTQVSVLPNFAMTDYGAQGRTRPFNPVDLRTCRGHQSIYTCLSRSSSLEGTLILYPFKTEKITSGATGDLRREYRELEILDDITRMRQDARLDASMPPRNSSRNVLILWYQNQFGKRHLPTHAHPALQTIEKVDLDVDYSEKTVALEDLLETIRPLAKIKGRKRSNPPTDASQPDAKRPRLSPPAAPPPRPPVPPLPQPVGLFWDNIDWSCAYDAMLGCLWNIFHTSRPFWNAVLATHSDLLVHVTSAFESVEQTQHTLEQIRDQIRDYLYLLKPSDFPRRGASLTDIMSLTDTLFTSPRQGLYQHRVCTTCGSIPAPRELHSSYFIALPHMLSRVHSPSRVLVRDLLELIFNDLVNSSPHCRSCTQPTVQTSLQWTAAPPLLAVELQPDELTDWASLDIGSSTSLMLPGTSQSYCLTGVIYLGGNHFTCRYIDSNFTVWSHDGVDRVREMSREFHTSNLLKFHARTACLLLYKLN